MAYTLEQGSSGLNAETIDSMVKQVAARTYKLRQAVSVVPTSSLDNTFFRKDPTILTGGATADIKGVPFGASFPTGKPKFERLSVRNLKFAFEDNIAWELIKGSAIDIQARTVFSITEGVVNAWDLYAWDILSQSQNFASSLIIQSYSIANSKYWNGSSAAIVNDLGAARRMIGDKNYDNSNTLTFVSTRDLQSINDYVHSKGAQYSTLGQDAAVNGRIMRLAGTTLVETPTVTSSFALMLVPKTCATYYEFESLKSTTIEDPYKSLTIRVVEEGAIGITDPLSIVIIRGTQGVDGL
jgi:hypothetical protein